MKKAIMSPLCSAFVIPGLGQILNEQLKKGLAILGGILVLFIAAMTAMYSIMKSVLSESTPADVRPESIMQKISAQDFSALWIILGIFALLWIFSVLDAFWAGRKIDRLTKQDE